MGTMGPARIDDGLCMREDCRGRGMKEEEAAAAVVVGEAQCDRSRSGPLVAPLRFSGSLACVSVVVGVVWCSVGPPVVM